ncbi:HU family DNA-binding protein [Acidocella facilis]|uniref:HU family DNA-binding protein n=1 Tax=Acidocella facilis TaxID=525 RepID=UPI001F19CD9D|nr:HU family DNA-binding protein [Acidocella facilis]
MTKQAIANSIQRSLNVPANHAARAAGDLIESIIAELKATGSYTLPGFGTFNVKKITRKHFTNPQTGKPVVGKGEPGNTVRFNRLLQNPCF